MKLLLIGAGIRTPLLVLGLIRRQQALDLTEVVLYDRDQARLTTMAGFVRFLAEQHGARFTIAAADDLRQAATGAGFVFSAIRVGQEEHRILDEQIPLKYGVLGQETTGPGGMAVALRTIPVLLDYARVLEAMAPDAWFVNFTNPAGLMTQALLQHTKLRVIGICDTPTSMRASLARFLDRTEDELFIEYVGLNHLGWIRRVLVDGRNVLPGIIDRYEELRQREREWALFDAELVRLLGMLPNEYLYYFYYRQQAVDHIRASRSTRGQQILDINRPLWQALHEEMAAGRPERATAVYERQMLARSASYMDRESGRPLQAAAADASLFADEGYAGLAMAAMMAVAQPQPRPLILNVANQGCLAEVAADDVVEVTTLVGPHGLTPLAQPPMPEIAKPLVLAIKEYERLTIKAAVHGSADAAIKALVAHPLVGSYPLARQIVTELLEAHRAYLPQFTVQR